MTCIANSTRIASSPAESCKASISFLFTRAARFFGVLRFYFYGFKAVPILI